MYKTDYETCNSFNRNKYSYFSITTQTNWRLRGMDCKLPFLIRICRYICMYAMLLTGGSTVLLNLNLIKT